MSMRENISIHWQIVTAALFSVLLITGAYFFARGFGSPQVAQASSETALLQAIATKDSDNDGLPDWEEALYGTDPHNPDTFHLGMTDGEAVARGLIVPKAIADVPIATSSPITASSIDSSLPPAPADGTITAAFAKSFFTLYLAAKQANGGANLTEAQTSDIANQAITALSSSIAPAPDFKSAQDLTVTGSGPEALKEFAASAEAVLLKNTADATTTELEYLKDAIEKGDDSAYGHIASIAKAYRDSAAGLAILPVPKELAADDLLLINSLMRMGETTADFTRASSDPLAAILALQQYPLAVTSEGTAFIHLGRIYAAAGVSLVDGTPGAQFVNMVASIEKQQAASASSGK